MYTLQIKTNNGEFKDLELDSKFTVNLNFTIRDFKAPSDIKGSFSKTISIYGTPYNNTLLSNIYNLGSLYVTTKPNRKIEYRLFYSGFLFQAVTWS